jgi:hypothetical protein
MPNINLTPISPSQLSGAGESGLFDVSRFTRKFLAQGDSWFSIGHFPPWSTTNLLQQMVLTDSAVAVDCAHPGRELAHMTDTSTEQVFVNLLCGNIAWKWDAILLSGGGNDLIDAAKSAPSADAGHRLLFRSDEWANDAPSPERYLSVDGWKTFCDHMEGVLQLLLQRRDSAPINRGVPILLHTYDYCTPRNAPAGPGLGPWLYKAFHDLYALPEGDWPAVSDALIDRHAELWVGLAEKYSAQGVHVVDTRGSLTRATEGTSGVSGDWENEIHPTPHGYSLLAEKWRPVVDALG